MKKVSEKIKVFLVDDHPIVRSGIKSEFKKHRNIELTGEASSGKEALKLIRPDSTDVILMDISMPEMSGIELAEKLLKRNKRSKILALSMHDNKNYILEMIRLGATGYVIKDSHPDELIRAIESVNADLPFYSSMINELMIKQHINSIRRSKKKFVKDALSDREIEVLVLIADGCTNREIAKKLKLSIRTIEAHRENIMQKLDIKTIAGLTKYAINNNLISIK
ncbi:response regulator transcription factor [soil metagenome]